MLNEIQMAREKCPNSPSPISLPYDSPSHWNHHNNLTCSASHQLNIQPDVHTSSCTLDRINEHRGSPPYGGFDDMSSHTPLPLIGWCSSTCSSSGCTPFFHM